MQIISYKYKDWSLSSQIILRCLLKFLSKTSYKKLTTFLFIKTAQNNKEKNNLLIIRETII